jgi:hypothetical protein
VDKAGSRFDSNGNTTSKEHILAHFEAKGQVLRRTRQNLRALVSYFQMLFCGGGWCQAVHVGLGFACPSIAKVQNFLNDTLSRGHSLLYEANFSRYSSIWAYVVHRSALLKRQGSRTGSSIQGKAPTSAQGNRGLETTASTSERGIGSLGSHCPTTSFTQASSRRSFRAWRLIRTGILGDIM